MIDLDLLWRLVIVLASLGVIPLLLMLGWVARRVRDSYTRARDSYTEVLLGSCYRGHRRRRKRLRHTSTPAGARRAPGPAGRHSRRNP